LVIPRIPIRIKAAPPRPGRPWAGAVAVAVVVAAAWIGFISLGHRPDVADPVATGTFATEPTSSPATAAATSTPAGAQGPRVVGLIKVNGDVTDRRATDVAHMFDTYFAGVNAKDFDAIASVLDPAGGMSPDNAQQMSALRASLATVMDYNVILQALHGSVASPSAIVSFRSTQAAGHGPHGRESETCTQWRIVYTLSFRADTGYRIFSAKATSTPCY
jgi:hypothetical protein